MNKGKFKILFAMTPSFDPFAGGVQQTTFKLGRYFHEQNHEVHYFSMAGKGHKVCEYGILHHPENSEGQDSDINNNKLKIILAKVRPDIVINQMPYVEKMRCTLSEAKDELRFLLIGCLRNALFSVRNNVDDYAKSQLPAPLVTLSKLTLIQSLLLILHKIKHARDLKAILDVHDYFFLLTPSNKLELEWFVGKYKEEKVEIMPNSVPFVVKTKEIFPRKIVHVGRLTTKQKRSDLLIPLWGKLVDRLPGWEFVVVGDGPYKETMENEISNRSLERIKLVGYADPEPYYRNASLFVMSSSFEGFPNVLLEAQSYGLVPFAFDSYPALGDILTDGQNGFTIAPFDIQEMADQIQYVANDENAIKNYSNASLINAEKYTTSKIGEQWLRFFKKEMEK